MKFAFIAEHQHLYPVRLLCGVMNVSQRGFYGYLARVGQGPTARERDDGVLSTSLLSFENADTFALCSSFN